MKGTANQLPARQKTFPIIGVRVESAENRMTVSSKQRNAIQEGNTKFMKYAIRITSRHTGEDITLGTKWPTKEQAEADADVNVCPRCFRYSIVPVGDDDVWLNKNQGFVPRPGALSRASRDAAGSLQPGAGSARPGKGSTIAQSALTMLGSPLEPNESKGENHGTNNLSRIEKHLCLPNPWMGGKPALRGLP